jgi:membrane-bound inhibitor of C-type lysozyme
MLARTICVASVITFAALASPAFAADVNYTCGDGTRFNAEFSPPSNSPGTVVLTIDNTRITLPQVKSADGGRYANGEMEFWIRGKDASLTRAGRKELCRSQ